MGIGRRTRAWGGRANEAAHQMAQRIDDSTGEAGERLAKVLTVAVRVLRWPSGALLVAPAPFIVTVLLLGALGEGVFAAVLLVAGVAMAAVAALFWGRRRRILQAVEDPELLAVELRRMFNLTGRLDDAGTTVRELTAGDGWQVMGRLRAAWRGVSLPAHWIEQIGELRRARYFAPPKIGTTMTLTVAALWLVPVSVVAALIAVIGTIAGSL